jgi:hypothetical protein
MNGEGHPDVSKSVEPDQNVGTPTNKPPATAPKQSTFGGFKMGQKINQDNSSNSIGVLSMQEQPLAPNQAPAIGTSSFGKFKMGEVNQVNHNLSLNNEEPLYLVLKCLDDVIN